MDTSDTHGVPSDGVRDAGDVGGGGGSAGRHGQLGRAEDAQGHGPARAHDAAGTSAATLERGGAGGRVRHGGSAAAGATDGAEVVRMHTLPRTAAGGAQHGRSGGDGDGDGDGGRGGVGGDGDGDENVGNSVKFRREYYGGALHGSTAAVASGDAVVGVEARGLALFAGMDGAQSPDPGAVQVAAHAGQDQRRAPRNVLPPSSVGDRPAMFSADPCHGPSRSHLASHATTPPPAQAMVMATAAMTASTDADVDGLEGGGPAKLFVGQIPYNMTESGLQRLFEPYGEILSVSLLRDKKTHAYRGCGFVEFADREQADGAIAALHDTICLHHTKGNLQVRYANVREREWKLFVGMLDLKTDEDRLVHLFGPYGTVKDVYVMRTHDGASRGCAFVKYSSRESAIAAIAGLHEVYQDNDSPRMLVVKFADSDSGRRRRKQQSREPRHHPQHHPVPAPMMYQAHLPMASPPFHIPQSHPHQQVCSQQQQQQQSSPPPQQLQPVMQPAMQPQPQFPDQALQPQNQHYHTQQQHPPPHASDPHTNLHRHHPLLSPPVHPHQPAPQFVQYAGISMGPVTAPAYAQSLSPSSAAAYPSYGVQYFGAQQHLQDGRKLLARAPPAHAPQSLPVPYTGQYGSTAAPQAYAEPYSRHGARSSARGPPGANLYVSNFSTALTDEGLTALFSPFGHILSSKVFIDKATGLSKGFGFVSFADASDAERAIDAMDGCDLGDGVYLKVNHKRTSGNAPY